MDVWFGHALVPLGTGDALVYPFTGVELCIYFLSIVQM